MKMVTAPITKDEIETQWQYLIKDFPEIEPLLELETKELVKYLLLSMAVLRREIRILQDRGY